MIREQREPSGFVVVVPATSASEQARVLSGSGGKVHRDRNPRSSDLREADIAGRLIDRLYQRMKLGFSGTGDLGCQGPAYWIAPRRAGTVLGGGPEVVVQWRVPSEAGRDQVLLAGFRRESLQGERRHTLAAGIADAANRATTGLTEGMLAEHLERLNIRLRQGGDRSNG